MRRMEQWTVQNTPKARVGKERRALRNKAGQEEQCDEKLPRECLHFHETLTKARVVDEEGASISL